MKEKKVVEVIEDWEFIARVPSDSHCKRLSKSGVLTKYLQVIIISHFKVKSLTSNVGLNSILYSIIVLQNLQGAYN